MGLFLTLVNKKTQQQQNKNRTKARTFINSSKAMK